YLQFARLSGANMHQANLRAALDLTGAKNSKPNPKVTKSPTKPHPATRTTPRSIPRCTSSAWELTCNLLLSKVR
ncbi:pentapeptide repeat-containing protein, partial [Pseudomonas sp. SWRI50]|nr:pentapeptide repeat-containing protein [Pseudomonas sp. SWRI50]